jgi:hypothetical protein
MAQEKPEAESGAGESEKLTYHTLEKLTVGRLRELAQGYDDLEGVIAMSKEQLVDVLARKKGIEIPHKVVVGIDKAAIKTQIRELKKTRDAALSAKDTEQVRRTRRKMHRLRHQLRRASTVKS